MFRISLKRLLTACRASVFVRHRLTLPQLAAALATAVFAERKLVPLSRLGAEAIVARVVHRLKAERELGRYQPVVNGRSELTHFRSSKIDPGPVWRGKK